MTEHTPQRPDTDLKPGVDGVRTYNPVTREWNPPLPSQQKHYTFAEKVYSFILVLFIGSIIAGLIGTVITSYQPKYLFGKPIETLR